MAEIDLNQKFPRMTPVKSSPPLFRINGCGTGIFGKRDYDADTGTYVATLCLSLLFVPVLALRAYRVARATQGWYFIGREPLSAMAKGWNALLLAAALSVFGVVKYNDYTSTPAYRAQAKMGAAHRLAKGGHLGQAANFYQDLAVAGADQSDNAVAALRGLMDNECQQAPLGESAGVFACAAQVARRGRSITTAEVADKGLKLVADKGDANPRDGVALLDTVRPLVIDTRPVDARRLSLLRKWAATDPDNLAEVVFPLASLLEQQGQLDEAKKLLLPHKSQLGEGEGARVLGTILGRQGDYDGAYALLWPYVKGRLDELHAAEKVSEDAGSQLWEREIGRLKDNQGPDDFYARYNGATKDEQRALVREYVNSRVRNDPEFTRAQEALERATAVVPVALELGIVMLQRAQGQTDPGARKAQLESAEQVFLAIGGVAGETDEYRLSLGQVYYWLGKQAEGHKLFDDYLATKQRAFEDLLKIASRLRSLGAVPEARALAEEAYNKTSKTEEQHEAAGFRALCFTDTDDQIVWLNKADTAEPSIKASLSKALGEKAIQEGRDDEAARQFRGAIDAYAAMPRSASTVNETALAYFGIFQATGDRESLDRCSDYFQQAVDLLPSDPILLFNAGSTLLDGALADVIGNDIDLRALHQTGHVSLLRYLYSDQAGHDSVARRVKEHPGIARALSYLEKVTVLSPKEGRAFATVYSIYQFTRDETALRSLEQRLRAADLDTSDELAGTRDFLSGAKDQQNLTALNAAMTHSEALDTALRPNGGRTAAVALDQRVEQMFGLDAYGGAVDADQMVALAEEAHHLAPSSSTAGTLKAARLLHAAKDLRRTDPDFDAFYTKYNRSVGVTYLTAVAASAPSSFQQKVIQHPDVQKVIAMIRDEASLFPGGGSPYEWALLKDADSAAAEKTADAIRKNPRQAVEQSIDTLLRPASASQALEVYWLAQIQGKPEEGKEAIRRVAGMGIPVPMSQ